MGTNTGVFDITVICMAVIMSLINIGLVNASDPTPLQDFCVAAPDANSGVMVNGLLCKDPTKVTTKDFVFKGFNTIGNTNNLLRFNATVVDVRRIPSLNTQGVSVAHVDFGPFGLNTPHHHPRASEIFTVISGSIYAGLVGSDNRLFSTILNAGDIFVFPQGLIHFQYNLKSTNARALVSFGSQFAGRVNTAQALFGATPAVLEDVLTKAYQVDVEVIEQLRAQFANAQSQIRFETSE